MENDMRALKDIETKRSDLIEKLTKIEEKKALVSQEVYDKVKKEYEKKLQEVEAQLYENIELVKAESKKVKESVKDLAQQEKDLKLKLEEIELRYTIGEFDDEAYNTQNGEAKDKLRSITAQLKKLDERGKWLDNFMAVKDLEAEVEEPKPEPPPEPVKEDRGLKIDEHVLEEKQPGEEKKLDELLVEDLALTEVVEAKPVKPAEPPKAKKDEVVPCPKCGHKNAPDSWYCEKCGAEILDISAK